MSYSSVTEGSGVNLNIFLKYLEILFGEDMKVREKRGGVKNRETCSFGERVGEMRKESITERPLKWLTERPL